MDHGGDRHRPRGRGGLVRPASSRGRSRRGATAAARDPGHHRDGAAARPSHLPRWARHRHRSEDGHRAPTGRRATRRRALPRRPGRAPRAGIGADRSAAVPGPAETSGGRARSRRGAAQDRSPHARAQPGPPQSQAHRTAGRGQRRRDGGPVRGSGAHRPGTDRQREAEPRLRAHHLSHRRRDRSAAGRPRQPRARERRERHRRAHAARSHLRALHAAAGQPAAGRAADGAGHAVGRGVEPRREHQARHGRAAPHRQPDQPEHRHDAPQGDVRESAAGVVAQPVRQGPPLGVRPQGRAGDRGHRRATRS